MQDDDLREHLAPAAVMIAVLVGVVYFAFAETIWVVVGFGACAILLWAMVRLETGVWVDSYSDIEFTVKQTKDRQQ